MPYIKRERRPHLDRVAAAAAMELINLGNRGPMTDGDLNYFITRLIGHDLRVKKSYSQFNKWVGVLECIKLELYRRQTAPYEDEKIRENGDV